MSCKKYLCLILIFSLTSAAIAGEWTLQRSFTVADDLKNDGILIKATNFGNDPAETATVKSMVFDTDWSNTNAGSLNNSTTSYYTGSDPEIAKLMNQSAQNYVTNWSGPRQLNINLSDLEIGRVYRIQILTAGANTHGNDFFVNNWQDYTYAWLGTGEKLLATYIWTAKADSIRISHNINWDHGTGALDVMGYIVHELPVAANPSPEDGAFTSTDLTHLSWSLPEPNIPGTPVTCSVYFGSGNPDDTDYYWTEPNDTAPAMGLTPVPGAQDFSGTTIPMPVTLTDNTDYYWIVNCHDPSREPATQEGRLWTFITINYRNVAHWTMDGLESGQYADASGEGHHADPNPEATPVFHAPPDAVKGNAVAIAPDSWASAGIWNPSEQTNQFTVAGWIKSNNPMSGSVQGIITKQDGNEQAATYWQLVINATGQLQVARVGGNTITSIDVPANQWVFVAVTFDNNDLTIYTYKPENPDTPLNFITQTGTYTLGENAAAAIHIGCSYVDSETGAVNVFDGFLDEIKLFNYPLTELEIADLYNEVYEENFCLQPYASALDVTGPDGVPDCRVDMHDIAAFAAGWMTEGFYPVLP